MGAPAIKPAFIEELAGELRFNDTTLPSMPEAVQYIRQSLASDSVDVPTLSSIIQKDPVLATRIVRVTNSAFYRSVQTVENVTDAIVRIGLAQTQNIAMVLLEKSFEARLPLIESHINALWQESLHISSVARLLADYYAFVDAERAALGGLLSNVGALLLMTVIDSKLEKLPNEQILNIMINQYACDFGAQLLTYWEMDAELIEVAKHRDDWQRQHDAPPDLVDLVLLAKSCCRPDPDSPLVQSLRSHTELPAFEKIQTLYPRSLNPQEIVDDCEAQITMMRDLLSH